MCGTIHLRLCTMLQFRPRGEMDIILVFGTSVGGSNPSEGTGNGKNKRTTLYSPDREF